MNTFVLLVGQDIRKIPIIASAKFTNEMLSCTRRRDGGCQSSLIDIDHERLRLISLFVIFHSSYEKASNSGHDWSIPETSP